MEHYLDKNNNNKRLLNRVIISCRHIYLYNWPMANVVMSRCCLVHKLWRVFEREVFVMHPSFQHAMFPNPVLPSSQAWFSWRHLFDITGCFYFLLLNKPFVFLPFFKERITPHHYHHHHHRHRARVPTRSFYSLFFFFLLFSSFSDSFSDSFFLFLYSIEIFKKVFFCGTLCKIEGSEVVREFSLILLDTEKGKIWRTSFLVWLSQSFMQSHNSVYNK